MWEPGPGWRRLPGAGGPATQGLWLAERGGERWVVKRLARPDGSVAALESRTHAGWWRREVEVARAPETVEGPGLVPAGFGDVDEDGEGVTLWSRQVVGTPPPGLFVARALGRFAAAPVAVPGWGARSHLADRLTMAESRGGWPMLARTPLGDVTERLWRRREHWLQECERAPQGRVHGDAVPGQFLAARGEDVVTVDWQCFGSGALGSDLGYFALSSREGFEVLLEAYAGGAGLEVGEIVVPARVHAVYSILSRAEWALRAAATGTARAAPADLLDHPAVSPYVRALRRQLPQAEALL
ncbi:MAG: aminoglycoside phosphotransferase family protein [Marmoricola sp.]|nr:aminoglycoside phosphotransferase family protein [Marmoricola sp.]